MQQVFYPPPYRIVTVYQPWADLLTADAAVIERIRKINPRLARQLPKDIENRSRGTDWRGTLFIHAALKLDLLALARFGLEDMEFVRGAVVGVVRLTNVVTNSRSTWAQRDMKNWVVADPLRLDSPIECAGVRSSRIPPPPILAVGLARLSHQQMAATQQ